MPNFLFAVCLSLSLCRSTLASRTQNLIANLSVSQSGLNNVSKFAARGGGLNGSWQGGGKRVERRGKLASKSFDSTFGVFNLIWLNSPVPKTIIYAPHWPDKPLTSRIRFRLNHNQRYCLITVLSGFCYHKFKTCLKYETKLGLKTSLLQLTKSEKRKIVIKTYLIVS